MARTLQSMSPATVDALPPPHAKRMYKIIALVDGVATSVFDGITQYHPFVTIHQDAQPYHQGGLYVYSTIEDCLRTGTRHFPGSSRLRNAQRAIAVVLAWNDNIIELPVIYGAKRAYSYVQLVDMLPLPPTYGLSSQHRLKSSSGLHNPAQTNIARAQARTLQLEVDVQDMERQLEFARRLLGTSGRMNS
ncbi:hypothetical protein VaNZ11_012779 [Volvox africanus]|uniref:Uncharacterized protein n=1 Tax=Volvox africanus TaxID=51714 RepID=A0ABQ5SG26_9CHLO|nr:hypothetical protein VaNZ11_012779 [Volvox africanus]